MKILEIPLSTDANHAHVTPWETRLGYRDSRPGRMPHSDDRIFDQKSQTPPFT